MAEQGQEQGGLSEDVIARFKTNFESDAKNRLAQTVCVRNNPLHVLRRTDREGLPHIFTHKVETEGKPVTDQKASGRCWIYAMLNCMRVPFVKELKVEDFEFSQNYLFFWDKIERLNFLLHAYIDIAQKGEAADGRLLQHLLFNPSEDGGQWQMLVNLVEKYGVVPKKCFPESWNSENSRRLGLITNNKMREFCMRLNGMVKKGSSKSDLQAEVELMTEEIYRIVSICLGSPPDSFTWEYYNKDKQFCKVGPISPLAFYKEYVKPHYNIEDKVVLVNDTRPEHPYDRLYTVEYLGNMTGGRKVLYINQNIDTLKKLASTSIKENEVVWFGCDVNQHCAWQKCGVEDVTLYDYELVFGTSIMGMSKAERLLYRDSLMTHAMVLTAVSEEDDKTTKWRVENSWGEAGGEKGYLAMTDDWFSEFVFEIVVDRKHCPPEVLDVLQQEPVVLPAWDPMGALAHDGPKAQL